VTDPREVVSDSHGDAEPSAKRLLMTLADALSATARGDFEAVADWALEAGDVLRSSLAAERAETRRATCSRSTRARLYERAMAGGFPSMFSGCRKRAPKRSPPPAGQRGGRGVPEARVDLRTRRRAAAAPACREQLLYSGTSTRGSQ